MNKYRNFICLIIYILINFCNSCNGKSQNKDLPYDYYPKEYDTLSQKDWPKIKETFNHILSFKTIADARNYDINPHRARFLLARITKINWTETTKKEISSYLTSFLDQLLQGKSYLNIDKISFPQEDLPTYDPVNLPKNIIWVLFSIDVQSAFPVINNIWTISSQMAVNSYMVNLREFTLWLFETSVNNNAVDEFFMNNYTILKNNLSTEEVDKINRTKLKCEISRLKDQKKAWEYLWDKSEMKKISYLSDSAQFLWYKNILLMKKIYGNLDMNIILNICDSDSSINKKYIFLYSACFNINSLLTTNQSSKIDGSTIDRIIKTKEIIENKRSLLKSKNVGNDFLTNAFNSMQSNLLEKKQ